MRRIYRVFIAAFVMSIVFFANASAQANKPVELGFLVDGSGSIKADQWDIMKKGIAAAVRNPACVPQDGTLELTIIQFSSDAKLEAGPTLIKSQSDANDVANAVLNMVQLDQSTNYEAAFDKAVQEMTFTLDRQVINIATDGDPNMGNTKQGRDNAINRGIDEIDAEAIIPSAPSPAAEEGEEAAAFDPQFLRSVVVYPQPGTLHPPEKWPPKAGGWVRQVDSFQEFESTVCDKLKQVVIPPTPMPPKEIPEPITIVLLGSGLASLAGAAYRKRRSSQI